MTQSLGVAESMVSALRRSRWVLLASVLVGIVAVNLLVQSRGPEYAATSKVLLADANLGAQVTGSGSGFVDPQRAKATDLALGSGITVFRAAAKSLYSNSSRYQEVASSASVTGSLADDVVTVTATADTELGAVMKANAVANAYAQWRGTVAAAPLVKARELVEEQVDSGAATPELRERLTDLRVLESLAADSARVIESANTATQTSPRPIRDTLLGLGLGLVCGLGIVILREGLNIRVRGEAEVEEALGIPVLAVLPRLPKRGVALLGSRRAEYQDGFLILAAHLERQVKGSEGRIAAVTSSVKAEGKTSTASNLAVALALRGERVLLMDCDWRAPRIARVMNLDAEGQVGVRDVLRGTVSAADAIAFVPFADAVPSRVAVGGDTDNAPHLGLSVLPAGSRPAPSASTDDRPIGWDRLSTLLDDLRGEYDWILLDTPPALQVADMTQISQMVDGILVVTRLGATRRRDLRSLERQFGVWPIRPVGAVLTFASAKAGPSGYGYGDSGP